MSDLRRLTRELEGVTERTRQGVLGWRYHGRLVARQLDGPRIVIRTSFDARDVLMRSFPETFSVPPRFSKHMMVVADLRTGDSDAIEEAVIAAWRLQSGRGPTH